VTRRVCVRCGRVGSLQFAKFPQGDACTAEKACRRRIQDHALDRAADIDDDRWFDYVREDFPKSLGIITAHSDAAGEDAPRYWVGLHGWNPEVRACSIVLFEEAPADSEIEGHDPEDWEHPCFTTIVVSQKWDEFELLPLTEVDLIDAAQEAADERSAVGSPQPVDTDPRYPIWDQSWHPGEPVPSNHGERRYSRSLYDHAGIWTMEYPPAIEAFYSHWRAEWNEDRLVDINGNIEYVERYIREVIHLPLAAARVELKRLLNHFRDEQHLSWRVTRLMIESAIAAGALEEALDLYKTSYGFSGDEILSLRLATGTPPTGGELANFGMVNLKTQFRSSFSEELMEAYEDSFEKAQVVAGVNLLQSWAQHCEKKDWRITPEFNVSILTVPSLYAFFDSGYVRNEVKAILGGAESELRTRVRNAGRAARCRIPAASPASETLGAFERLTCTTCGREFERARARGRKPQRCAECRT